MTEYLPEGCLISSPENQDIINSEFLLKEACLYIFPFPER